MSTKEFPTRISEMASVTIAWEWICLPISRFKAFAAMLKKVANGNCRLSNLVNCNSLKSSSDSPLFHSMHNK
ncbi:hypothetical protein VIGAN_03219500 [Vigna angularis var. angularis]|uniref:Uncharacterized protein n=1 Tax=Vigna angularis var. angularis TaxID=157739 RepID=A0A0S3RNT8_PHAAN|nr:hypothetical protein VIGAN_03219500 [Vigna angularis var. angularis]